MCSGLQVGISLIKQYLSLFFIIIFDSLEQINIYY